MIIPLPLTGPWLVAAIAGGSYLLGSIPFGLILTWLAGYGDIREIGSGNIGATNVLRTGDRFLAALTLILDGGKGALAVFLAEMYAPPLAPLAAAMVVIGHTLPVWLAFQGGKGVATMLGALLVLTPFAGEMACLAWVCTAVVTRVSSLAALVSVSLAALLAGFSYSPNRGAVAVMLAIFVVARHYENIQRLIRGEESHIRLKRR
jgi:glycerol-3-phosphate acyltransferase PlsY